MEERKFIIAELAGNCPELVKSDPAMPFHLPQDYFKGLTSQLLTLIQHQQNIDPAIFNQGSQNIEEASIFLGAQSVESVAEELNTISPILAQLQQQETYQIPLHYFEQQDWTSLAAKEYTAVPVEKNPLVQVTDPAVQLKTPMIGWRQVKKLVHYAAAAIIAGLLFTSAFLFSDKNAQYVSQGLSDNELLSIAEMPNESLENYLLDHAYLETHDLHESADWSELDEFHQSVSILTDEELETYLTQNSINQ